MTTMQDAAQYLEQQLRNQRRSFHTRGINLDALITLCEESPETWTIVDQVRLPDEHTKEDNIMLQSTLVHHSPSGVYFMHREVVRISQNGDETPIKLINCLKAIVKHGHAPYHSITGEFERVCFEADGRFIWRFDKKATAKLNGRIVTHWPLHWSELTEQEDAPKEVTNG